MLKNDVKNADNEFLFSRVASWVTKLTQKFKREPECIGTDSTCLIQHPAWEFCSTMSNKRFKNTFWKKSSWKGCVEHSPQSTPLANTFLWQSSFCRFLVCMWILIWTSYLYDTFCRIPLITCLPKYWHNMVEKNACTPLLYNNFGYTVRKLVCIFIKRSFEAIQQENKEEQRAKKSTEQRRANTSKE